MNKVFLSLGTNVGSRRRNLAKANLLIDSLLNTVIKLKSSVYETAPMYNERQGCFLNQVVLIETKLNPIELLEETKYIEILMGRKTKGDNMPRIIDIDILDFEGCFLDSPDLILPHPAILDRKFVLQPWIEISPNHMIEGQNSSIKELYSNYLGNRFKNQKVDIINS